jgi:hypothetical protein
MTELSQVAPRCIHLQSKAMAVFGEGFESDPDYQNDLTDFWCIQTAKGLGPDGSEVGMKECCNRERSCYQEY